MKILILSTSSNNTETVIDSLKFTQIADVEVIRYDARFHERCAVATQTDPTAMQRLHSGELHFEPDSVRRDAEMLTRAKQMKPDAIIYISAWEGDFVPQVETLGELNTIAPMVHMCFDASDPPWWPQLIDFEKRGVFWRTVNIDGNHFWPGGKRWGGQGHDPDTFVKNGLTLLTPLDPRPFAGISLPYKERPYRIGYAGNAGGPIRSTLVERLKGVKGFTLRLRDDHPLSYPHYCWFLKHTQVSVSVPFSGSGQAKQVKGRVVESAYAGACLLDWKSDAMRDWFIPRFHYEEYESLDEGLAKAEWLASDPTRAADIAFEMHHRVMHEHAPGVFWRALLADLPIAIPTPVAEAA